MTRLDAFFDGSCEPVNPGGRAGFGWIVKNRDTGEIVAKGHGLACAGGPRSTSNVGEYAGAVALLEHLVANHPGADIDVYGDSSLVVNMVAGRWGRRNPHKAAPHLIPWYRRAREIFSRLHATIAWIPREENAEADELSKAGARSDILFPVPNNPTLV